MIFTNKKTVILILTVITVFLLSISAAQKHYQFPIMERIVSVAFTPFNYLASKIGNGFKQTGSFASNIFTVYRDNQNLRTENDSLKQNNLNTSEVLAENVRLRSLLDYKSKMLQFDLITAAVISRDPGTWTNTLVINRGTADGIAKDMPVITPLGVVGNVVSVYANSAKVQLIIDSRSAIGALVQRPESRVAAIVEGNSATPLAPRMVNIARDADIIKGDQIITSGFGGIYPKGLSVGVTVDVINDEGGLLKYAVLKPTVDFDRLEEVLVIVRFREPIATIPPTSSATPSGQGASGR